MQDFRDHVEASIRRRKLFRPNARILVAVSGGLDSMVLLHVLHELASKCGWRLRVAHFNHQLRGRASDADERFVRNAAARLDLPVRVGQGDVKAFARRHGLSIEMAARELRHRFLAQAARRADCSAMAVAHHADDQVELFFLRVLRGTGGEGLAGMKWRSASPADRRLQIIRPLLDVPRETLEQFARTVGIRHREDASNASRDILRNRVRHELLPVLRRRYQPAVDRTIVRLMEVVGAEAEVVAEAAHAWLKRSRPDCEFMKCPVGLQRRIIQIQLQDQGIEAGFDLIESLRLGPARSICVSPGRCIQLDDAGRLSRAVAWGKFQEARKVVRLKGRCGTVAFAGVEFTWRTTAGRGTKRPRSGPGQEIFDASPIGSQIVLRHWQPGDRFRPIGMKSAVKLQDWFTNRKVPADQRRGLVVATTARGEIFWIEGQRIADRFKLTTGTRRRLIWHWNRP